MAIEFKYIPKRKNNLSWNGHYCGGPYYGGWWEVEDREVDDIYDRILSVKIALGKKISELEEFYDKVQDLADDARDAFEKIENSAHPDEDEDPEGYKEYEEDYQAAEDTYEEYGDKCQALEELIEQLKDRYSKLG